jgi:hypothetical protein
MGVSVSVSVDEGEGESAGVDVGATGKAFKAAHPSTSLLTTLHQIQNFIYLPTPTPTPSPLSIFTVLLQVIEQ